MRQQESRKRRAVQNLLEKFSDGNDNQAINLSRMKALLSLSYQYDEEYIQKISQINIPYILKGIRKYQKKTNQVNMQFQHESEAQIPPESEIKEEQVIQQQGSDDVSEYKKSISLNSPILSRNSFNLNSQNQLRTKSSNNQLNNSTKKQKNKQKAIYVSDTFESRVQQEIDQLKVQQQLNLDKQNDVISVLNNILKDMSTQDPLVQQMKEYKKQKSFEQSKEIVKLPPINQSQQVAFQFQSRESETQIQENDRKVQTQRSEESKQIQSMQKTQEVKQQIQLKQNENTNQQYQQQIVQKQTSQVKQQIQLKQNENTNQEYQQQVAQKQKQEVKQQIELKQNEKTNQQNQQQSVQKQNEEKNEQLQQQKNQIQQIEEEKQNKGKSSSEEGSSEYESEEVEETETETETENEEQSLNDQATGVNTQRDKENIND